MNWNWFDRRVCLTTHPEEWELGQVEFARVGLEVEKFQSLPIDNDQILGPHQSFSGSVNRILREFWESGAETLLSLEDDCQFKDYEHLEQALSELPARWDVLYLGGNLRDDPVRYSPHLFRVTNVWTTHAIAYRREIVPYLLEKQPGLSEQMFDQFLGEQLHKMQAFIVAPTVAWQRSHYSSIWGRDVNYDDVFQLTDERLK
jgi:hypothetical protein